MLSDTMLADYARTGVLILENFVPPDACDALRRRAAELVDGFDPASVQSVFSTTEQTQHGDRYFLESGDKIRFFFERDAWDDGGSLRAPRIDCLNKIGHALHDLDSVFDAFSRTPDLGEVVRRLGVADPAIIQSMYIFKPPHIGGEVVCHQDSTFIYTEPESCIGFWFALEDATPENGCMEFIPGVHRQPLRQRNRRTASGDSTVTEALDATPWPEHLKVPAPASKGSLVIFSGRTPHLSAANNSSRSRHAYTLHVIDRQCHDPADNWLQRGPDLPLRGFE
ncbi:MAG: phytanoyl-CoA dioxygenase family protein [Pseudomonadota bacterium]